MHQSHMKKLDPVKRKKAGLRPRHVVWGLMLANWRAISVVCLMCALMAVSELSSSVGIQQLLEYLETDGEGALYRPILRVAILFLES